MIAVSSESYWEAFVPTLAMLAAFASIAFVKGVTAAQDEDTGEGRGP